jgi:predicted Zn-dependent protease
MAFSGFFTYRRKLMTHQTNPNSAYFDLHISGLGYLNRIREVLVKRGEPFWACDIAALHGAKEDVQTTRFDCRVSGSEAEKLIKRCEQAEKEHKKILIGFKLGDLYAETFVYEKGDKKGQTGVSLKARLLFISWIKVDGDMVYKAPARPEATETCNESSEPAFEQSLQAA